VRAVSLAARTASVLFDNVLGSSDLIERIAKIFGDLKMTM